MNREDNQLSKAEQHCPEAKGKKRHLPKNPERATSKPRRALTWNDSAPASPLNSGSKLVKYAEL